MAYPCGTTNAATVIRWCCCTVGSATAGTSPATSTRWPAGFGCCFLSVGVSGHTADVAGPITLAVMAQDTIAFLDKVVGGPVRLVGYSAGATVALRVAVGRPDLVDRLVLISGAFHRDGMILRPTADAAPPPQLVAAYAEVSPDGAEHLPVVIAKIAQSVAEEPGRQRPIWAPSPAGRWSWWATTTT